MQRRRARRPRVRQIGAWSSPNCGSDIRKRDIFNNQLESLWRLAPTKPVQIAEVGTARHGGNKAAWIHDMFAYVDHHHWIQSVLGENPYLPFPYFYDQVTWSYSLLRGFSGDGFLTQQLPAGTSMSP